MTFATACIAAAAYLDRVERPRPVIPAHEAPVGSGPWTVYPRIDVCDPTPVAPTIMAPRPVFRHSVVPGGAYTRSELRQAILRMPEVAHHFRELLIERMEPARLSRDGDYYVSYKKDGKVYWTSRKLRIPAGEPVLADGAETIRSRCGNRLSATPMEPRLPEALEPIDLDLADVAAPVLPVAPFISPSGGSWLPIVVPFIPVIVFPGGGGGVTPPIEPPPHVVPEPRPWMLLALGVVLSVAGWYFRRP